MPTDTIQWIINSVALFRMMLEGTHFSVAGTTDIYILILIFSMNIIDLHTDKSTERDYYEARMTAIMIKVLGGHMNTVNMSQPKTR